MNFQIPDDSPWRELNSSNEAIIEDRVYFQLVDSTGHAVSNIAHGKIDVVRDGIYHRVDITNAPRFDLTKITNRPYSIIMFDSRGIVAYADIPLDFVVPDHDYLQITGSIATIEGIKGNWSYLL